MDKNQNTISGTAQKITFKYAGGAEDWIGNPTDEEITFNYNPSCLHFTTSMQYSDELAETSLCLSMAAFNSNEVLTVFDPSPYINVEKRSSSYSDGPQNIKALLKKMRSLDIFVNSDYLKKPTPDSIGVALGITYDTIQEPVIIVAIRGGGYEQEWVGNAFLGRENNHFGFSQAAERALDFIKTTLRSPNVIEKIRGKELRMLITGFSRAAAVTNLIGGILNRYADNNGENIGTFFANGLMLRREKAAFYGFETPRGVEKQRTETITDYGNIFSIINPYDFVTKVAPKTFGANAGFIRFGTVREIPCWGNIGDKFKQHEITMSEKYLKPINTEYSQEYVLNTFLKDIHVHENTLDQFLDSFFYRLSERSIPSRNMYVDEYQEHLKDILEVVMTTKLNITEFVITFLLTYPEFIYHFIIKIQADIKNGTNDAGKYTTDCLVDVLRELGIEVDENEKKEMLGDISALLMIVKRFVGPAEKRDEYLGYLANIMTSMLIIPTAHYPELCLAWIRYLKEPGNNQLWVIKPNDD